MIQVKWASWKVKNKDNILSKYDTTTVVLKQKDIYVDPSDREFLDKVFKEYVRKFLKKKIVKFELSHKDIFFYGENANIYLLNYIYNNLFPTKKRNPFDAIMDIEYEGSMNLSLFNGMDKQVLFLIDILDKMEIDFKKLSKKYMLWTFPNSLECYNEEKVYNVRYEKWKR